MNLRHYEQVSYDGLSPRNVDVWVPEEYETSQDRRFPVLYMHDGQNLFEPEKSYAGVTWGVAEAITKLSKEGIIEPAIVVGIWNTENRFGDYQPIKPFDTLKGKIIKKLFRKSKKLKNYSFVADKYISFIVHSLKPMVDKEFRTKPKSEHTFIMGSSMGALISMYAISEYPDVFGGAGCLSTHWPVVQKVILPYLRERIPKAGKQKYYFDHGTEGLDSKYGRAQKRIDNLMLEKGYQADVDWMTRVYEGHKHHESCWQERIDVPLSFLLRKGVSL